jgi:V8-like Glu-specific endopeptidase
MTEVPRGDWQLFPPLPEDIGDKKVRNLSENDGISHQADDGISYQAIVETLCGASDDSQPVEQYDGSLGVSRGFVFDHQSAVGQVQWNNNLAAQYTNPGTVNGLRWGTGTLIADDLFLTAGHLFDQTGGGWQRPRVNGTSNIIPSSEIAANMHVNFEYQVDPSGTLRAEQQFAITGLLEYRLGGLDYAIVRLAGNPGHRYGTGTLSRKDALVNDMLCVIGHPAGVPKRIEAGPTSAITGDSITYSDIDTLGGNSGSGIWHAGRGTLVGVHTNGGCTNTGGSNLGVRIERLLAVSPLLRNLPTSTKIAAASWGPNRADVFSLGNDLQVFHKALTGSSWYPSPTGWEPLGGAFRSAPTVAAWGMNRLDLFAVGMDRQMFHKAWDGNGYYPSATAWEPLGGYFISPPTVASWAANRLNILALGGDRQMFHKAWDGTAWRPSATDWEPLGGGFISPPTAVAWGPNRLDIFAIGLDGAMYHKAWEGSAWWPSQSKWHALGGFFTSPPAVESWGPNRLDIFAIGGNGQMYHKAWSVSGWYPSEVGWQALGGGFNSRPSVVSWGSDRLDIFAIGRDSQMYHKAWSPAGWYPSETGWQALGGLFTSAPTAVSWGPNRIDIFGLGLDRTMYHKTWNGSKWLPSEKGWTPLGGIFRGP